MEEGEQVFHIGGIISGGGAEEDIAAAPEIIVDGRTGNVNHRFSGCQSKRFFIMIESNNFIIGIITADCLCDRAADESESDKTDFLRVHSNHSFRAVILPILSCLL